MTTCSLSCVAIVVTHETEEAICELLGRVFDVPTAVFTDLEAGTSRAQVYVTLTKCALIEKRRALKIALKEITAMGLDTSAAKISSRRLKPQDWAESWKRHFKPIEIGDQLLIKPSWSRRRPRAGAKVIILDPGLSFGTGQHPTTRYCLEQVAQARRRDVKQGFLDIGTGTGILAIAGEKLGYQPVVAFDFDADAVRIARSNAKLNEAGKIRLSRKDLTRLPVAGGERFDIICANLTHDLLAAERMRILNRLKAGGTLILAGILTTQYAKVERVFCREGLYRTSRRTEGEWTSGVFRI